MAPGTNNPAGGGSGTVMYTYGAADAAATAMTDTARRFVTLIGQLQDHLKLLIAGWYQSGSKAAPPAKALQDQLIAALNDMTQLVTDTASTINDNTVLARSTDTKLAGLFGG
jgi:uncharacterized protein YukE